MVQERVVEPDVGQPTNGTTESSGPMRKPDLKKHEFTTADTVASVTIAVLATTVLLTIICIIRLLKKRRRQQQGQPMNQTPTVYASTLGASVMAYHNLHIHMQNDRSPSWEPIEVMPEGDGRSQTNDPQPSTSYNREDEIPVVSIISIHNHIQQRRNSINARNGVVNQAFVPASDGTENVPLEDNGNSPLTNHNDPSDRIEINQSDDGQQHSIGEGSRSDSRNHSADIDR